VTDPEIPFVSHAPYADTTTGSETQHDECRRLAREGAARLHAQARTPGRAQTLTDTEALAIARMKLDKRNKP
jgi:hypothetical protein